MYRILARLFVEDLDPDGRQQASPRRNDVRPGHPDTSQSLLMRADEVIP
jgi:hypothetical protein